MKYSITISKKGNSTNKEIKIIAVVANGVSPAFSSVNGELLNDYEIMVEDFMVEKQIYAPNLVKLQLLVKSRSGHGIISARKKLRDNLLGGTLSLTQTYTNSDLAKQELTVANEYPIIELKFNSNMSQISMELFTYSPDRYSMLNKHSEAFTGKTIDEILKKAIEVPFGCKYDISHTLHLHYIMEKEAGKNEKSVQYHRIPYAVQYNESTYSFISRLAKRHGEFLYFEDDSLHVGCNQNSELKDKAISIKGENIVNISFEDSTPRENTHYFGYNHLGDPKKGEIISDDEGLYKVFNYSPSKDESSVATYEYASNGKKEGKDNKDNKDKKDNKDNKDKKDEVPPTNGKWSVVNTEYANNDSYVDIKKDLKIGDRTNKKDEDKFLKNIDNFKLEDDSLLKIHGSDFYIGGSLTAIGDILGKTSYVDMGLAAVMNLKALTYDAYQQAVAINKAYNDNIKDKNGLIDATRYNDGPYGMSKLIFPDHFAFVSYNIERALEAFENRIHIQLNPSFSNNDLKLGNIIELKENNSSQNNNYYIITALNIKRVESDEKEAVASRKLPYMFIEAIPFIEPKKGGTIPYFDQADLKREASAQVAIVVDTKDPYRLNRVRVCYPWQFVKSSNSITDMNYAELRENATPWIRVATPAAKGGGGFLFTPELYSEVMVNYENGNIEKPYVESSVYRNGDGLFEQSANNEHTSSISSHHGQKIIFHDGNNGINLFTKLIGPVADLGMGFISADGIKGTEKLAPFDGYTEITDNYGLNSVKLSTSDREISIKSSLGKVSINALTGISIESPTGDIDIKGKNISISAGNRLSITSGTNIDRPSQVSSTKLSVVTAINDNLGLNFALIRTILESLFKPVGGSMVIKSNRYLCLEAGRGNARVSSYIKQNPLHPKKEISELEVLPIKEPLLHFLRIFDNCKVARNLISQKLMAYRNMYNADVTGYNACLNGLKEYLLDSKKSVIDKEFKKLPKVNEIEVENVFKRVNLELQIDFSQDLKKPDEDAEKVSDLLANTVLMMNALNELKETMVANNDKLAMEINSVDDPLRSIIIKRLFDEKIPKLPSIYSNDGSKYAIVRQAIDGKIAAKRILLLALIELMQERQAKLDFHVESSTVIIDLPKPIQEILERFITIASIKSPVADVFKIWQDPHLIFNVTIEEGEKLSVEEMSQINASWRYIVNNMFADESMSWKELLAEATSLSGIREDSSLYFTKEGKGQKLDRGTLDDGKILFSDDRHITYGYDSHANEFIVTDSSSDNEITGKLKEVMNSLENE